MVSVLKELVMNKLLGNRKQKQKKQKQKTQKQKTETENSSGQKMIKLSNCTVVEIGEGVRWPEYNPMCGCVVTKVARVVCMK